VNEVLLYVAAALCGVWGVAHIAATRGVVAGFGELSEDNRNIITMEWIVEGVALLAVAAFVAAATGVDAHSSVARAVLTVAAGVLLVMAGVSLATGFRVRFLPFRLCPFIFGASAVLIVLGAWL
jgi:hypothetical protein